MIMRNYSDEKLIIDYLAGNEKSLEILIKHYLKPIYSFIYRYVKDAAAADDLTQEVFIRAWRNLKKFDQDRSFKAWLFAIAKNASLDFLKKKKSIPFSEFENKNGENMITETFVDSSPLPNEFLERKDAIGALARAVNNLLPKYRQILVFRHNNDLSFREISERLNEPLNTVKSRHRRALILLKKILVTDKDLVI